MAILPIVLEGDPRLRRKAARVRVVDTRLRRLAEDMFDTMLAAPGVGLAGPQVGIMERIIVVSVPGDYIGDDEDDVDLVLFNPEIVRADGQETLTEGCLSIPGIIGDVPRFTRITVKAMDLDGRPVRFKADDYVARVLQHEIDHLEGVLFVDRVVDKTTIRSADADRPDDDEEDEIEDALEMLTGDAGTRD